MTTPSPLNPKMTDPTSALHLAADPPAAAPDPSPDPAPDPLALPEIHIDLPPFNVFAARQHAKIVRHPGDRTRDQAEIRDVHAAAQYAAQVAMITVSQVNDAMVGYYQAQLQHLANATADAIVLAIARYDFERRQRAWYRTAWRWIRRQPTPAFTQPRQDAGA